MTRYSVVMAACVLVTTLASAQVEPTTHAAATTPQPDYGRCSEVCSSKLVARSGESLGGIQDLILDPQSRKVLFVVVSTGEFLGTDDRDQLTAIPYELITWRRGADGFNPMPSTDVSKASLEKAPAFDVARLDTHLADAAWCAKTHAAFGCCPKPMAQTPDVRGERIAGSTDRPALASAPRWCLSSDAANGRIVTSSASDEKLQRDTAPAQFGRVQDIFLERNSGNLVAVLVTRPGQDGATDQQYLIPCSALRPSDRKGEMTVNRTHEKMVGAPVLDGDPLVTLRDEEACGRLHRFYESSK